MSVKKMYMPEQVCFGEIRVKSTLAGFYSVSPEAFIKIIDDEGDIKYQRLNEKEIYFQFHENTERFLSVKEVISITNLIDADKYDKPISATTIKLHLLKYKLKSIFNNDKQLVTEKTKVKK